MTARPGTTAPHDDPSSDGAADNAPDPAQTRLLTADLPGVGGVLKQRPEDFLVEEQPAYEPIGHGEHVLLYVQKTELTTHDLVRRIAKSFHVGRGDVGYAGLKDKQAVTRQHFSVYAPTLKSPEQVEQCVSHLGKSDRIEVLWSDRHTNKLRTGHHGGNRFVIRIRDVEPTAAIRVRPIFDRLERLGAPNAFGAQRFGFRANAHVLGRLLLLRDYDGFVDELLAREGPGEHEALRSARAAFRSGDYQAAIEGWPRGLRWDRQVIEHLRQRRDRGQPRDPRAAVLAMDRAHRKLLVSAAQSAVFNRVLDRRIEAGTLASLVAGDLAWKHDSGAVFAIDAAAAEADNAPGGRVERLAVSPSGPLWGSRMTRATGGVDEIESACAAEMGLGLDEWSGGERIDIEGARRPLRVPLGSPDYAGGVDEHGPYIRLSFDLPKGAFATTVCREVMKPDPGRDTSPAPPTPDALGETST